MNYKKLMGKYLTLIQMTDSKTGSLTLILELDADINILITSLVLKKMEREYQYQNNVKGGT